MSKSISFRDLKKFPQFKEVPEIILASPEYDQAIEPFVYALGIDTREPVEYAVNNHRDLSNNTGIGIRIVGEIRRDAAFTNSPLCDIVDRIVVAGIKDASLGAEMENLTRQVSNIQSLAEREGDAMQELVEDSYDSATMEITALEMYVKGSRGGTNIVNYNVS